MERCATNTSNNSINKHIEEIVKLYFQGVSVKKAIKEVRAMENLKSELNKSIVKNKFNLVSPEVVKLSQKLDREIVKEQRKKNPL